VRTAYWLPMPPDTSRLERPETVGLVYRSGHVAEKAWSSIPSGLARGLRELGLDARLIDAQPGRVLTTASKLWATVVRRHRHGGLYAPEIRELYCWTARLRGLRTRTLSAVVQMGSDFDVPFPARFVTFEDMTVRQAATIGGLSNALGGIAIERWAAGQARCYESAMGCCVASRWAAESIVSDYGVEPKNVKVVGFGRNYEPRAVNRNWTRPRFFFMGYDWERKNGPMVLRAFAHVKQYVPEARLDVAGGHPHIEMDGVFTHGPIDISAPRDRARAEALFEAATCFVMPSVFEPFGMVYVEAGAAGVASIGTTVGGASDAIGNGGLLVDPSSERALVEAMTAMCDPTQAAAMGDAAQKRSRLFTWRAVAERIVGALEPSPDSTNALSL
jgi:glycosyltransferase involved in cell wall biosynthesis